MGEMDEVLKEFLVESYENLDQLDSDFVTLEENPEDPERLKSIFRTIHTIKGTCGFLGLGKLESVTHVGENLLSRLRDGDLTLDSEMTSALLAMVDAVREMLSNIEETEHEGDGDYSELIANLTRLQDAGSSDAGDSGGAKTEPEAPVEEVPSSAAEESPSNAQEAEDEALEGDDEDGTRSMGEILVQTGAADPQQVADALLDQATGDPRRLGEILVDKGSVEPTEVKDALIQQQKEGRGTSISDSSIRVRVEQLDKLMNLVGELVLARNQILQFTAIQEDASLLASSQRLNLVTTELQEGVMKTRMQPIGNVWSKFPRVIRDLANQSGKKIRLEMDGKETELDKTIIESIKDPLTHIIRNSVDHGIEMPEERTAAGKPEEGRIYMRAFHEGGQVNIEISDDGQGLDHEKIKQKAIERKLVTPEQAQRMGEREIVNLVFAPGFSTAAKVTNISGRGVGMDVVKSNIEKIGGTVDMQSTPGKGTTLRIRIPLTLAIIPALTVTSGGGQYAIPQVSLLELVRLEGEQATKGIEMIHGAPVYRLRGNLLPLVYLNSELKIGGKNASEQEETPEAETSDQADELDKKINIVVLRADEKQFGLVVDEINDTQEIVVKPLDKQLKNVSAFAGATIMGDGNIALILDVMGLAQQSHIVSQLTERSLGDQEETEQKSSENLETLLLFAVGEKGRMAVPLSKVARLEEFKTAEVECAGDYQVIQYRDQIMPLIPLATTLGRPEVVAGASNNESESDTIHVVVHAYEGRYVGLVVDQILDIVDEVMNVQSIGTEDFVEGSLVIQGRVTELLDMEAVIRGTTAGIFEEAAAAA